MKVKLYTLAIAALLAFVAMPVVAAPVEVTVDDRPVETTEVDELLDGKIITSVVFVRICILL